MSFRNMRTLQNGPWLRLIENSYLILDYERKAESMLSVYAYLALVLRDNSLYWLWFRRD